MLSSIFKLREKATPELIGLLESVTLGTNGAHYRHLDTAERIHQADNPLHLSLERSENKVLGNITFCRRESAWYVRYFAFDPFVQGSGEKKSSGSGGRLKSELEQFFEGILSGMKPYGEVNSFYAYIDPNNEKSLWMSENFGFESMATIATQTFSRSRIPEQTNVRKNDNWEEVAPLIRTEFSDYQNYFEHHLQKGPFYILRDQNNEIIACAKATKATWKIERLPGKLGGILPKIIPFIPGLRNIIKPKKHTFFVPEAVFVRDQNPDILQELFEGILHIENEYLLIWWTDEKAPLYKATKDQVRWGLLHTLIGTNKAHLMVKYNSVFEFDKSTPVYTCGFDFV